MNEEVALTWTDQLFAIEPHRYKAASKRIASWDFKNLTRALLEPMTADSIVAAVLLVESVDALVAVGVPQSKLEAKLRNDADVWPTWAELRAASLFARFAPEGSSFGMETEKASGRHADFTLIDSGKRISIEFKALGLSDAEAEFCARVAPMLPLSVPDVGLVTFHSPYTSSGIIGREDRRAAKRAAVRLAKNLPPALRGAAAATIVGHNTERNYVRRLTHRLKEAIEQVPDGEDCWLAFHWSNGAPTQMVSEALAQMDVPANVRAVVLVGSLGFPGRIDNFMFVLPAPFAGGGKSEYHSAVDPEQAKALAAAADRSGGIRPTLLMVPVDGQMTALLHRDGTQRILPFNLILEADPGWVAEHFAQRA